MKNLNDFVSEEDKKKSKAHITKSDKGADDEKYIDLMMKYKKARRGDSDKANLILKKAQLLGRTGDVSKMAKLAAAYL